MLRDHYSAEITPQMAGKRVKVAGWVAEHRILGSLIFVSLRDREGRIQITALKKTTPTEVWQQLKQLGKEYVIAVEGRVVARSEAPRGVEIHPEKITILNRAQAPLPLDISGRIRSELATRLGARFMDLRRTDVKAIFMVRDCLLTALRNFIEKEGFIEIHTPKIIAAGAEGGATLFPIEYFGRRAYLAQSPQLFKQMMMATGFDRVYEIGPYFRAEESATTRHLAEFTMFDAEIAFIESPEELMQLTERMVIAVLKHVKRHAAPYLEILHKEISMPKRPFPRLTHDECTRLLGLKKWHDIDTESERRLGQIVKKEYGADFYFITRFPTVLKRETFYAMRDPDDPNYTLYFDFEYGGLELYSGGQREHRYDVLVKQIREAGLNEGDFEFYLKSFRYGMPPHGGFGMGIDRFVQKLLDLPNIRETVLFPRDRFRVVP